VGVEEDCGSLAGEVADQALHGRGRGRVETARGLIKEQHGRPVDNGTGEGDALLEALRQASDEVGLPVGDAWRATSHERMRAAPPWGWRRVARMRTVVVLPAPFGPRRPRISPRSTVSVRRSRASRSPNRRETASHSMAGPAPFTPGESAVRCPFSSQRAMRPPSTGIIVPVR
jgi:hypothetical protein